MYILSGKSKCRERDVCSFLISSFLTLRTRLRISMFHVYLCKKNLINEMSLSDCISLLTAFAQMESKRNEGRRKL